MKKRKRKCSQKMALKRRTLYTAMRGKCWYCDRRVEWEASTLDHLRPFSQGGSDGLSNLVLACQWCNETRSGVGVARQGLADPIKFRAWARKMVSKGTAGATDRTHQRMIASIIQAGVFPRGREGWWLVHPPGARPIPVRF